MSANKPQSKAIWIVAGGVVMLLGLVIYQSIKKPRGVIGSPDLSPRESVDCPPEVDDLILKTQQLHSQVKWTDAKKAWEELAARKDLCRRQKDEVDRNLQIATKNLGPLMKVWERPKEDKKGVPDPTTVIPTKHFLEYYKPGRTVDSSADVTISGKGTNLQWFVQSEVSFAYQYKMQATTTVKENLGGETAVFEMKLGTVEQIRAVTQLNSLSIKLPEDSAAGMVIPIIDDFVQDVPSYRLIRRLALVVNAVDPGLKSSLTAFAGYLKIGDRLVQEDDDVEFARRVMELSGQKLRIEYDRDGGIQKIDVLAGKSLPPETLDSLAHNSSLLLDYYLFPAAEKKEGERWDVDAAEVAGLFADGFSAEAKGNLKVKREHNEERQGEKVANLKIIGGEVNLTVQEGGQNIHSTIKPKASNVKFSIDDRLVRRAHIEWDVSGDKSYPLTHLLFGTKSMREMTFKSDYRAREKKKDDARGGPTSN